MLSNVLVSKRIKDTLIRFPKPKRVMAGEKASSSLFFKNGKKEVGWKLESAINSFQ